MALLPGPPRRASCGADSMPGPGAGAHGGTGRLVAPGALQGQGRCQKESRSRSSPAPCCQRPPRGPSVSCGLGRAAPPWSAALSRFDEPSGGEWEGWASGVGVAAGCPVAELAGRTPGLGHTQVPGEAQHGLWTAHCGPSEPSLAASRRPLAGPEKELRHLMTALPSS